MPEAVTWAIFTDREPRRRSPITIRASVWLHQPLWFLLGLQGAPKQNHQITLKNKTYYSEVLKGTWHAQGPQNEVEGREKDCKPGALPLLWSMGGVPRVSRVHSFLANLKHKSWN